MSRMVPAPAFFERVQHHLGPLGLHRVLLVPEATHRAPPLGTHVPQILARLACTQVDVDVDQRCRELGSGPGAILVQQRVERGRHLLTTTGVGWWPRGTPAQTGHTGLGKAFEQSAHRHRVVSQVRRDRGCGPPRIGQADHLHPVPFGRRQAWVAPQRLHGVPVLGGQSES
jgi:hypothetical protein